LKRFFRARRNSRRFRNLLDSYVFDSLRHAPSAPVMKQIALPFI
jgi:hypothetical protein